MTVFLSWDNRNKERLSVFSEIPLTVYFYKSGAASSESREQLAWVWICLAMFASASSRYCALDATTAICIHKRRRYKHNITHTWLLIYVNVSLLMQPMPLLLLFAATFCETQFMSIDVGEGSFIAQSKNQLMVPEYSNSPKYPF